MKKIFYLIILFLLVSCSSDSIELEINNDSFDNNLITVYISGEINIEGVYQIESDKLLIDLINKAGGLTKDADISNINLARKLNSNEMIIIPKVINYNSDNNIANKLININTASFEELKSLPNIGDATARNIIEYRTKNGFFSSIEDIKKVNGIKDALFEKIKEYITV